jgi:hypothetical protein
MERRTVSGVSRASSVVLLIVSLCLVLDRAPTASAAGAVSPALAKAERCLADARIDLLGGLFDSEPAGVVGADYQRATELPDGRVLWTFQDAAIRVGPDDIRIVHNIGAIQDGACFTILYRGTRDAPQPFLYADRTVPFERWYWPLDAETGADGRIYVFVAEMVERGEDYLTRTEPTATLLVALDPATMLTVGSSPAPNSSPSLYGWSVTSDATWTYLYGQCYRQFGFDPVFTVAAHDRGCSKRITVARVARGHLVDSPQYWDGARWQADPARAAPVMSTDVAIARATQIEWTGASFVSVDKVDDWWGQTVTFGRSIGPTGPFVQFAAAPEPLKCPRTECNTFFAMWVPGAAASRPPNTLGWGIAHNRWDGVITARYRPSFHTVVAPTFLPGQVVYPVQIPDGVTGTPILNVTAIAPHGRGHVTAFPCDRPVPQASNLNYAAGETVANVAIVRPDAAGRVCVVSHATTELVVDLAGSLDARYGVADNPVRVVDTRIGVGGPVGRLEPGRVFEVPVPAGVLGVPVLNVTAVAPSADGHATVFPCDRPVPQASNLNYAAGQTVANVVMVRPDARGRVCVVSHASIDLVVDLAGSMAEGYTGADNPERLVDTRDGLGGPAGRLQAGQVYEVQVPADETDGAAGVPVLNVTAVAPSAAGHVTVFPCDRAVPQASNLNYAAGETVANMVMVRPDVRGRVCVVSHAPIDLVVDLSGSFDAGIVPVDAPMRITDTRLLP